MGTTANDAEVIVLSDDDDDDDEAPENDTPCGESSVYIVEAEDSKETGNIWIYVRHRPASVVLMLL